LAIASSQQNIILSDTVVIIDYWRKPKPVQTWVFDNSPVAFCGVTRAELYVGAKSDLEMEKYSQELTALIELPITHATWGHVGRNLQRLRSKGITLPFSDVIIATVALEHNAEIWTYDSHFKQMRRALPGIRLFQEPASLP
jgi:predicted nucleic acid-binding protein